MRIVLDSNVLLVALGKLSKYRLIWNSFLSGEYQLFISEDILFEYHEILLEHASSGIAELVIEIFAESPDVIYQHIYYSWNLMTNDPDDNKFFDIAVAANADYLVTNDSHFNMVKDLKFPSVKIISANEFLQILDESARDIS